MSIQTKISAALLAVFSTAFVAQAARAQQVYTGSVLGIEYADGDRCNVTLISSEGQTITEVTDALTCDSVLVGNRIQIVQELVQVEVLPSPETGTVTRVENGDRACYIGLTDADNNTSVQFADFSVCEQDLVGARVQLTYGTTNLLARSCQGDVDCGRTEEATIITQADILDRPSEGSAEGPDADDRPMIGSLPDGNYRYWNGATDNAIVTNQELLENGGVTFLFSKRGNNVTGIFAYVDGEAICVQGQVNEDTVTGISVQNLSGAGVLSDGETFASFGPSDRLQVRRGRQINDTTVRYASTLLNLEGLNQINAGTVLPPRACRF